MQGETIKNLGKTCVEHMLHTALNNKAEQIATARSIFMPKHDYALQLATIDFYSLVNVT